MRFTSLFLPLLAVASASPIILERDETSIINAINAIVPSIVKLNNSVNGLAVRDPLGLPKALVIQSNDQDVSTAITKAIQATNASKVLDFNDSLDVGLAVISFLPNVTTLLQNIVNHKPAFDSAVLFVGSISPQVKQDLQQQEALSLQLGQAIKSKVDPGLYQVADQLIADIKQPFDNALAAYAKPGGIFQVGPFPSFTAMQSGLSKYGKI